MMPTDSLVAHLSTGRLYVVLATVLAALSVAPHWSRGHFWVGLVELAACVVAALSAWWPRSAGTALGLVLASLLFAPQEWATMSEYATFIPILGAGLRGRRQERLWMTVAYGLLLAALTYQDMAGDPMIVFALAVWAALIGFLWLMGDLFTRYRNVQDDARVAALREQRFEVARDLHDTVSRDLSRASLQAQVALAAHPSPELTSVVESIHQASAQLRWMLALLREPSRGPTSAVSGTASNTLEEATRLLRARGFVVTSSVDGNLDAIPAALVPTLRATIGEACANMERHADPAQPCAIVVSVGHDAVDAVFLNTAGGGVPGHLPSGVGLVGLRERLAFVGGALVTEQKGTQWITRINIPL